MSINFTFDGTEAKSNDKDPILSSSQDKDTTCYEKLTTPKRLKCMQRVVFVIIAVNMLIWGNMLLFITIGAANKTMPDERTRKKWIEIDFQIINAFAFLITVGPLPWRIRDLYHLYREKHRPKLLQRHSYTKNLIWIQLILWSLILNSISQIAVCICIWSMSVDARPKWFIGLFGGLSLISGLFAGLAQFILKRKQKKKAIMENTSTNIVKIVH